MWNSFKSKYKHIFSHINRRAKSWEKYTKAIERCILVLKKVEKNNGYNLWCTKTMTSVLARFKKYGITQSMVDQTLQNKWLTNLSKRYTSSTYTK